ncbi:hypothetical protein DXG01_012630 [Tephrocybe rancida]|nr:hypothetical protein DXG01_012630 [Tephrocybe rancida]
MTLGPGQDAYERARRTYTELLTAKERTQIEAPTTLADLLSRTQSLSQIIIKQQPQLFLRIGDAATKVKPFENLLAGVCKLAPAKGGDLIWASISFVLEMARNNAEMFNEILNFFVTMSEEMEYVKLLEDTFKDAPLVVNVVEALYVSVLDFWVKAVKYYRPKPSKSARFFSSLKNFTSSSYMLQKFQQLKADIVAQKARLHNVANAQHFKDSAVHHQKAEATRRATLVALINAPSYEADLHSATKHHHSGTCEWVLRKEAYIAWRDRRDHPLLVIYGIPGAGKTILSSWLINSGRNRALARGQFLLYHFFKASDDSKRTPLAAIRSLIEQLYDYLRRSKHALLPELEAQLDALSGKTQVNFMQLWFILSSNLEKLYPSHQKGDQYTVTIILDAMDECKGPKPLVRELHKLVLGASGAIRVLVTSRKSGEHVNEFARVPADELLVLEISRDDVKHDIASFTRYKIEKMERLRGDQHVSLRNTVIAELGKVENHQGMFLWSYLVCKEVKHQLQVSAIWRLLKNLPKGLDAMYARICIRLAENDQHREFGRTVLQWIVASSRPLHFAELEQALKTMMDQSEEFFDDDVYDEEYGLGLLWSRKDIVEACGDLVTYTGLDDGDMIGLVHLSAHHFLASDPSKLVLPPDLASSSSNISTFLVDIPKAEYVIGTTCLDYLLAGTLHSDKQFAPPKKLGSSKHDSISRRHPLFNFAVTYWPEYVFNTFSLTSDITSVGPLAAKTSLFIAHSFSVIWLQEYIQYFGAETATYIVRRFSDLPAHTTPSDLLIWAKSVAQILGDFSRTLSGNPQMIRMCLPRPGGLPNAYQPHSQEFVRPANDGVSNISTPITTFPPLEKSNGRWLHYDPITDSVFSVDLLSESICLRRHILSTGMPLRPAVFDIQEPDLFSFRSAAVSARAGFIAVTFGSTGPYYERAREMYTTVCWSLITSGTVSRTSEWAEVAFVERLDGPQADKYTNTIQEVEMVAFGRNNTLVAPGGIWNILTEECVKVMHGAYDSGAEQTLKHVCFSGNGERIARIRTGIDEEIIEVLDLEGTLLCSVCFPRSVNTQLLSFSATGKKLVFQQRPLATSESGKFESEFKCLVADNSRLKISIPHPLSHKVMQHPRFTKDEDKMVSFLPGMEFYDETTGERSSHAYGCSVAVWTFDKDAQGHCLDHASMIYLFKFRDKLDDFAFCLTRSPKGSRNQYWEDGLIAVDKAGTVSQRLLSQTWTQEEEEQLHSSHNQLCSTFGWVMAEKVIYRRSSSCPELLICLEDVRYDSPCLANHYCLHVRSDEDFTMQKWVLGSPKPILLSSVRNIFHQAFRHNENCFFSQTGTYLIDVPANELYQVHSSNDPIYLKPLQLPFIIDGCAFSSDDQRVAFIHFEGTDIMVSVFDITNGQIAGRRATRSLNGVLGLDTRSDLDVSEIQHSKSSSRFNKITFSTIDSDSLAISFCYFKFKLALGTFLIKQVGEDLVTSKINDQFMFSLRFSTCGKYLYNADMLFSEVPILFPLSDNTVTLTRGTPNPKHPTVLKFGTFYVCSPHIFKLREDGQTGAVYLDHKPLDQDDNFYRSREICVRPDALPDRTSETTLIWPHGNVGDYDEVELVIAAQGLVVIKTGIRSHYMMREEFCDLLKYEHCVPHGLLHHLLRIHSEVFDMLPKVLLTLVVAAGVLSGEARQLRKADIHARQVAAAKRFQNNMPVKRAAPHNITFSNPKASGMSAFHVLQLVTRLIRSRRTEFYVDGTTIPEVDFDVGPSWSGLLPISANANETRKLFFWFFPPGPQGSLDDLIFWYQQLLPGIPPFSWSWGQAKPTQNEYSWTNLSSVLWVEQPVGTGFSQGVPNIKARIIIWNGDENDLAAQLVGFLQQFLEVFSELKQKNFYVTGESYAGTYVPYIANYIYEHPNSLNLKLQGTWTADPSLSYDVVQEQIPAVDFVHRYENVFAFNQTFLDQLDHLNKKCNYANYTKKYLKYPPKGKLPLPGKSTSADDGCDLWDLIFEEALRLNPAFNIYRIFDTYPILWDVLGFPGSFEQVQIAPLYFDREDVKKAIHAPVNVAWEECSSDDVFPHGDASLPSALSVLPNVIENNKRTVIIHGLADFILIAEGTRIIGGLNKLLGAGKQGFQKPIADNSFIVDGVGAYGAAHTERGLTYLEVELSGHMIPQFAPWAAFQSMQYLMGFRDTP